MIWVLMIFYHGVYTYEMPTPVACEIFRRQIIKAQVIERKRIICVAQPKVAQ